MIFFKEGELNLPLEIGFFNTFLVLDSFFMTTPRTFQEGRCFFTYSPWILVNVNSSACCYYRKWPQGSSTTSCHIFVFLVNFLLFSIGLEWISDVVFVLGVQDLDSVTHRRLSILFKVLFPIGDYSMFNQLS